MSEIFNFDDGNQKFEVRLRREENNYIITIKNKDKEEEKELHVSAKVLGTGQFQFTLDNIIYKCAIAKDGNIRFIHLDGEDYELKKITDFDDDFVIAEEQGSLTSPMPGRIVKVLVKPGDKVHKGQDLIIIEAMKMENKISAPFNGVISRVYFPEGDQIEANTPLIEMEEIKEEESGGNENK